MSPGTHIAAGEELAQGEGTYTENDELYSSVYGINESTDREATVRAEKKIKTVKAGDEVYGLVLDVMDSKALIIIDPVKKDGVRYAPQDIFVIKVAAVDSNYLKSIKDAFRMGDIIKARVVEFKGELELNTKDNSYGVVKAFCGLCKIGMTLKNGKLFCNLCEHSEPRKVSEEYLIRG